MPGSTSLLAGLPECGVAKGRRGGRDQPGKGSGGGGGEAGVALVGVGVASHQPSPPPKKGILKKGSGFRAAVLGPGVVLGLRVEADGHSEKEWRKAVEKAVRPIAPGLKAKVCPEYGRSFEISLRCESEDVAEAIKTCLSTAPLPISSQRLEPRVIERIEREPVPEVHHETPAGPGAIPNTDEATPSSPNAANKAKAKDQPKSVQLIDVPEPLHIDPSLPPSSITLAQALGIHPSPTHPRPQMESDASEGSNDSVEVVTNGQAEVKKEDGTDDEREEESEKEKSEDHEDNKLGKTKEEKEVKEEDEEKRTGAEQEEETTTEEEELLEPLTLAQQCTSPRWEILSPPRPSASLESSVEVLHSLTPLAERILALFVGQTGYQLSRAEASLLHRRIHGPNLPLPDAVASVERSEDLPPELQPLLSLSADSDSLCLVGLGRRTLLWSELVYLWLRYPEARLRADHLHAAFAAAHRHRPGPLDTPESRLRTSELPDWIARNFSQTFQTEEGGYLSLRPQWRTALQARKLLVSERAKLSGLMDGAWDVVASVEPSETAEMSVGELLGAWSKSGEEKPLIWCPQMDLVLSLSEPAPDSTQTVRANPAFLRILRHLKRDMDVYDKRTPLTAGPGVYPRYRPSPSSTPNNSPAASPKRAIPETPTPTTPRLLPPAPPNTPSTPISPLPFVPLRPIDIMQQQEPHESSSLDSSGSIPIGAASTVATFVSHSEWLSALGQTTPPSESESCESGLGLSAPSPLRLIPPTPSPSPSPAKPPRSRLAANFSQLA